MACDKKDVDYLKRCPFLVLICAESKCNIMTRMSSGGAGRDMCWFFVRILFPIAGVTKNINDRPVQQDSLK